MGNKCDLDHDRKVSVEEGRRLASEWKCSFIECSAKHDENIKAAFNQLLLQVQENEAPLPVAEPGFWSRWCSSCCCDAGPGASWPARAIGRCCQLATAAGSGPAGTSLRQLVSGSYEQLMPELLNELQQL